jgi:hypothetical protein
MVGLVDAPSADEPSEYIQPWPKDVAPVPPFDTASVPVIFESVVVATQVGTPSKYARTKPGVPTDVVATLPALFPYTSAPDWMEAQPVPPLPTGRIPVTSVERATDAQVAIPAPLMERTNWLVQEDPWYAEATPEALVVMRDDAMEVTLRLVVVALVVVALEMKLDEAVSEVALRLVAKLFVVVALVPWMVVAKSEVEVEFVVVADVPKRLVMTPLVPERLVAKELVVVALPPWMVVANSVVDVALVVVAFTEERLVMVEVALLTSIGTEVVGESTPPTSSHA